MATYYHVAGPTWEPGEDLLCWERQVELGWVTAGDWKWAEAEVGLDGNVVCLFAALTDAREHQAEYGGTVLAVETDEEMHLTTVAEGFPAVLYRIPAYALTVVA